MACVSPMAAGQSMVDKVVVTGGSGGNVGNAAQVSHRFLQISSAAFYGLASFFITIVNKSVLTSYKFPSFQVLGLGQMFSTILVLYVSKRCKVISFPDLGRDTVKKIWPLPLIFLGNMIFGLGGTKELSLPMFTVLRRFSILMTMLAEYYILGQTASTPVQLSVYMMILGTLIAASNDMAFNLQGYTFVLLNDIFTATNGVYLKKKLDAKELGKYGLLFYNSLFMIFPAFLMALYTGEVEKASEYPGWLDWAFVFQFLLSCVMGFILSYSTLLCTQYNSALTTTIVGCLKNITTTYLGMVIGGDYVFSLTNFLGINLSVLGSLIYTWVTFREKEAPKHGTDPSKKALLTNSSPA